jgi:hypothetical protein
MTDFEGHLKIALLLGIVVGVIVLVITSEPAIAGGAFALAVGAGLLPDIDSHSSKPRGALGSVLILAGGTLALWVAVEFSTLTSAAGGVVTSILGLGADLANEFGVALLIAAGVGVALVTGNLLDEITTHRGWFHSAEAALFFGLAATAASFFFGLVGLQGAVIFGAATVLGYLGHIFIGDQAW